MNKNTCFLSLSMEKKERLIYIPIYSLAVAA